MRPRLPTRRSTIRVGTLAIVPAAWSTALFATPAPKSLPGVALRSAFLWRAEVALGIAVALLFMFVVLVRGWQGDLPNTFSERGAGWPEASEAGKDSAAETAVRLDGLQNQIDALSEELAIIAGSR